MSLTNPLLLEAKRIRAKKRFSQNFLVDEKVISRIADQLDLSEQDTVLEIGPGLGFLTEELLKRAGNVTAVELEWNMCRHLQNRFKEHGFKQEQSNEVHRLRIIEQDILKFDFANIPAEKFKVVGNLPYQITSRILFYLAGELEDTQYPLRQRIERLTLMVQKEVAERITAVPGQKAYNPLSIALQFWFEPRLDFIVPSSAFYPAPKVESAIITLIPRKEPRIAVNDLTLLNRLVKSAFKQKRKTIRNSLLGASFASPAVLDRIFEKTGIHPTLRAEALSIESFGELANAFGADTGQD